MTIVDVDCHTQPHLCLHLDPTSLAASRHIGAAAVGFDSRVSSFSLEFRMHAPATRRTLSPLRF